MSVDTRKPSRVSLDVLLEQFLQHLRDYDGASPATIDAYGRDCRRFIQSLRGADTEAPVRAEEVTARDIRLHLASLDHLKPSSIRRALYALRSFSAYLCRMEFIAANPASTIDPPRSKRVLPTVPDTAQCKRILAACRTEREAAIVGLLLGTGLRRSELLGLNVSDIAADLSELRVEGKGGSVRVVPLAPSVQRVLRDYLAVRESDEPALILNQCGRRMAPTSLYRIVRRVLRKAGLADAGITPHSMRHHFACHLLRSGTDLATVRDLLGHANISTTSQYLHSTSTTRRDAVQSLDTLFAIDHGAGRPGRPDDLPRVESK